MEQGDYADASRCFSESRTVFETLGDHYGVARSLNNEGDLLLLQGALDRAQRFHEQARDIALRAGVEDVHGAALNGLAEVAKRREEYAAARELYTDAIQHFETSGDVQTILYPLLGLGDVALSEGRHFDARSLYAAAVARADALGDEPRSCLALVGLGHVDRLLGDLDAADVAFAEAARRASLMGARRGVAAATHGRALVALDRRDLVAARVHGEAGREIAETLDEPRPRATALLLLAEIDLREGHHVEAAAKCAACLSISDAAGDDVDASSRSCCAKPN